MHVHHSLLPVPSLLLSKLVHLQRQRRSSQKGVSCSALSLLLLVHSSFPHVLSLVDVFSADIKYPMFHWAVDWTHNADPKHSDRLKL